jgi:cytochrome o ubiquinol oxidase operon protein cyoD
MTKPSNHNETAPGDTEAVGEGTGLIGYCVGLVLAAGLTAASFLAPGNQLIWHDAIPAVLVALAVAQMGVHLVFFLHITTGPESTNNVLALAFGLLIVFLLLAGTLFIMTHLSAMMPPMDQVMSMQH